MWAYFENTECVLTRKEDLIDITLVAHCSYNLRDRHHLQVDYDFNWKLKYVLTVKFKIELNKYVYEFKNKCFYTERHSISSKNPVGQIKVYIIISYVHGSIQIYLYFSPYLCVLLSM